VIIGGLLVSRTRSVDRLAEKACELYLACKFQGKQGQVVLDQIRTVDKTRLARKLGRIDTKTQSDVLRVLGEMFST